MKCPKCGNEPPKGAKYCNICGADIQTGNKKKKLIITVAAASAAAVLIAVLFIVNVIPWRGNTGNNMFPESGKSAAIDDKNNSKTEETSGDGFIAYYEPVSKEKLSFDEEKSVYYLAGNILVTAEENASYQDVENLLRSYGGKIVGYISLTNDYQFNFTDIPDLKGLEDLAAKLEQEEIISMAIPEMVQEEEPQSIDYTTDPWQSSNTGGYLNEDEITLDKWDVTQPDGTNWWAEAVMMPLVWESDYTFKNVNIGIIDSYFDLTNEDLREAFVEVKGQDGIDVANLYQREQDGGEKGKIAHGSHTAGIIAARNNKSGICGVSQNARLYGVSVRGESDDDQGAWHSYMFWKYAIASLVEKEVKAISISYGWNPETIFAIQQQAEGKDSRTYELDAAKNWNKNMGEFLQRCLKQHDFLIIASAGNEDGRYFKKTSNLKEHKTGYETTEEPYAEFETGVDAKYGKFAGISNENVREHIVIVGALKAVGDFEKQVAERYVKADFSNHGSRVDIYAPGGQLKDTRIGILSDYPDGLTDYMQGTSMAAPMVSGTAALIWGINPELTSLQVKEILFNSSDSVDNSKRMVNAFKAVTLANESIRNDGVWDINVVKNEAMILGSVRYLYDYDDNLQEEKSVGDVREKASIKLQNNETGKVIELKQDGDQDFYVFAEPGTYTVIVEEDRFKPFEETFSVSKGETHFIEAVMELNDGFDREVYSEVLDEYRSVMSLLYSSGKHTADEIGAITAQQEYRYVMPKMTAGCFFDHWGEDSDYIRDLAYAYYDINNDGIDELLLRKEKDGSGDGRAWAIYGYDGKKPVRLLGIDMAYRGDFGIIIRADGVILACGIGESSGDTEYTIDTSKGVTLEKIYESKELFLLEDYIKEHTEIQAEYTVLDYDKSDDKSHMREQNDIFSTLPEEFVFSSGAGGWGTYMYISDDGTVTGEWHDYDLGVTGDDYPNGTVHFTEYTGHFSVSEKINEYSYSMKLEKFSIVPGASRIEDGTNRVFVDLDPYGIDAGRDFVLFLPGTPNELLPDELYSTAFLIRKSNGDDIPMDCYALYNVTEKTTFIGKIKENVETEEVVTVPADNENTESMTEISGYMWLPIDGVLSDIPNVIENGISPEADGSSSYLVGGEGVNFIGRMVEGYSDWLVESMSVSGTEIYSIMGIHCGMSVSEAKSILLNNGYNCDGIYEDESYNFHNARNGDMRFCFITRDGAVTWMGYQDLSNSLPYQ